MHTYYVYIYIADPLPNFRKPTVHAYRPITKDTAMGFRTSTN